MVTTSPRCHSQHVVSAVLVGVFSILSACASHGANNLVGASRVSTPTVKTSDAPRNRTAVLSPGTQGPVYADSLVRARTEGSVLVQFVIDSTGRAMMPTLRVLKSDHLALTAAVRDGLQAMRYLPAEVDGRKVRQLGQQTFDFRLNGERGRAVFISPVSMPDAAR